MTALVRLRGRPVRAEKGRVWREEEAQKRSHRARTRFELGGIFVNPFVQSPQ